MTKKRKKDVAPMPAPQAPSARNRTRTLIRVVAGVALLGVIVFALLAGRWDNGGRKAAAAGFSPEEQKYVGRLLPKGYQEPKVAEVAVYTSPVQMTDIGTRDDGARISIPVADVTTSKLVKFKYSPPGGARAIPLLAYVKPSGNLFVAVSFCPPCEGEGQRLEPDGTMVCESCGTKRDAQTGVGISGACKLYPLDELPATIVDGRVTVDKAALDSWTPQPKDRKIG